MSDCSAVSTWSSWTGVAVWLTGIVVAVVELRRRRRARREVDEEVALEEDARADLGVRVVVDRPALVLSIRIVTSAPLSPACARSIFVTLPTSTPAIRTGDALRRCCSRS